MFSFARVVAAETPETRRVREEPLKFHRTEGGNPTDSSFIVSTRLGRSAFAPCRIIGCRATAKCLLKRIWRLKFDKSLMTDHRVTDLSHGHPGKATYDTEEQKWTFSQTFTNGEGEIVIKSQNFAHHVSRALGETATPVQGDASTVNSCSKEGRRKILNTRPKPDEMATENLARVFTSIPSAFQSSQGIMSTTSGAPS